MLARPRCRFGTGALAGALLFTLPARGGPAAQPKDAAATAFDDGVNRFEHADYAGAARAFLRADDLSPSPDAESNAIAAARRANDQLLVVDAAERAISRAATNPDLAKLGREALAEAAKSLAQVKLGCQPAPCSISIDGADAAPGSRYILPGLHVAVATALAERVEQSLNLAAGGTYEVLLQLPPPAPEASVAGASNPALPEPAAPVRMVSPAPRTAPQNGEGAASRSSKPFSPAIFWIGASVTAIFVGVTAWSGIDTLTAKSDLSKTPSQADIDDVKSKIHRSDAIFATTLAIGAVTGLAALLWVDWGSGRHAEGRVFPVPGGGVVNASGTF